MANSHLMFFSSKYAKIASRQTDAWFLRKLPYISYTKLLKYEFPHNYITLFLNSALAEIRGKRPFIITRSTFVGMGKYAGHWSGDIASNWHDMKMTVPGKCI